MWCWWTCAIPRERERDGKVPGTFNVTRGMLEFWIDPESSYYKPRFGEDKKFVFFCAGGLRSALAAKTAQDMGLKPVAHVVGGFKAWKEAGGPTEPGEGEEGRREEVAYCHPGPCARDPAIRKRRSMLRDGSRQQVPG